MKYRYMTPEQREARNERCRKRYAKNPEKYLEQHSKWKDRNLEKCHERHRKRARKRRIEDLNSAGVPKNDIRTYSKRILYRTHSKIQGYEIHHCFGYEDPNKFIYIPKTLHVQIHNFLRDNKISVDSNHWNAIRDLVNSCEDYTYIRT